MSKAIFISSLLAAAAALAQGPMPDIEPHGTAGNISTPLATPQVPSTADGVNTPLASEIAAERYMAAAGAGTNTTVASETPVAPERYMAAGTGTNTASASEIVAPERYGAAETNTASASELVAPERYGAAATNTPAASELVAPERYGAADTSASVASQMPVAAERYGAADNNLAANVKYITQTVPCPCRQGHATPASTPDPVPFGRYQNLTSDNETKPHVVVNGASSQTYSVLALVGAGAIALAVGLA
jgi:hypothetical protein